MVKKVYGGRSRGHFSAGRLAERTAPKSSKWMKVLVVVLSLILALEGIYCVAIFSDISFIRYLRNMYIETAMSTMRHQWLATAFIPGDIIDEVMAAQEAARAAQVGNNSNWENVPAKVHTEAQPDSKPNSSFMAGYTHDLIDQSAPTQEQEAFFELFHELDQQSMREYVKEHPEVVADGWDALKINEAGLDDEGTSIYTTAGDQVLAIDVANGVLLLRVKGSTYRGALAICKDPSRLKLAVSSSIGSVGQKAGYIAEQNDGLLAMTASGFIDEGGAGNGGKVAGGCMSSGETYGTHYAWGYKRIELHQDNRLYISDAHTSYGEGCTDAMEFTPALVVDGEDVSGGSIFTSMNPRACLGQTRDEAVMMLVIEGRRIDSAGTNAETCAEILLRYDCYQAMNMDGGTSAILWYDGEYVTRCSRSDTPEGRYLPNAWVYCNQPVED